MMESNIEGDWLTYYIGQVARLGNLRGLQPDSNTVLPDIAVSQDESLDSWHMVHGTGRWSSSVHQQDQKQ